MKKLKVFISFLCAMALMMGSLPAVGFAAADDITVIVDGVTLDPANGKAQIVGAGTTMVPFRSIFEALGFEVKYSSSQAGTVTAVIGYSEEKDIIMGLAVGSNVIFMCSYSAYLNDNYLLFNSPYVTVSEAVFIDDTGRTLVPARAISEALGAEVLWVAESRTVIITYNTEHYYSATDIPRYEYVTGIAYTSVSTDAYGNPLYVYPFTSVETLDDNYKFSALPDAGLTFIDGNVDNTSRQTWLYESQTNNILLIQLDGKEGYIYIIPYSNHVYPYYITGLSGTNVSVTALPNYTYVTGSECLSWAEDDDGSGDPVYKYKYNYDEANYYFEILESAGYECYLSVGNAWCFKNGSLYIDVEVDATLGYMYIAPFVGNATFETGYYNDDGTTYYNTDIPTFYAVTGIAPSNIEYDEDFNNVGFTYICTDNVYRSYIRALEANGFVDVYGDYTTFESPTNKYIIVLRSNSYVYVLAFDSVYTYIGTGVPTYTYATQMECLFWIESELGNHIYCYKYSTFDLNTYVDYLSELGYEQFYSTSDDDSATVGMSDGSHIVAIMILDVDGTRYIAVEPWVMEEAS